MKTEMPYFKYKPFPKINITGRAWPDSRITCAPKWCSVDLRDGNQALFTPMDTEKKWRMFKLLADMGFEEIEAGFPSASKEEYDFIRYLAKGNRVPENVTIQVLTQAREHLIRRTFESLAGVSNAIVHLYNSTSTLQRRVVFRMSRAETKALAVSGAMLIKQEAGKQKGSNIIFEYTPESFMATEPDFAVEICQAVMNIWEPRPERKMIINLPLTMEMATPNIYADQIEWFHRNIKNRGSIILSVHAHNDRGTGIAATELALLAGAERVEGTLFGNGERTGNADIITLALNLCTQGIDPGLDLSDMRRIISVYELCTNMPVHIRHPYAGELVYTAFSGSHQDAINKGMKARAEEKNLFWEVPYLPLDPADVGRTYESIVRINSQSGKGGISYVLENGYGLQMPRPMHSEFARVVQTISDETGQEVPPHAIWEAFEQEYLERNQPFEFKGYQLTDAGNGQSSGVAIMATIAHNGKSTNISGRGNGPIDAMCDALKSALDLDFRLSAHHEHALDKGAGAKAAAYIKIEDEKHEDYWGAGIGPNIDVASFKAVLCALNRAAQTEGGK